MSSISKVSRTTIFGLGVALILVVAAAISPWTHEPPRAATSLDVSIEQFGRYIEQWSEPEGYFDSDNFISNETSYEHVIDELRTRVRPGGVYIGVGPDQNLTYIAHTKPSLAIIVDIRRQNMLEHLLFKALFEQADTRADFLALLFAKQKPVVAPGAGFEELLKTIRRAPSSETLFQRDLKAVKTLLTDTHKLALSEEDLKKIEYTYRTFWTENL